MGRTLLFVAARMTSMFSVPRSDTATVSVPPAFAAVLAGALAGALDWDTPWVGLAGTVDGGAPAGPHAITKAIAPPEAISRKALRRLTPSLSPDSSRSIVSSPF